MGVFLVNVSLQTAGKSIPHARGGVFIVRPLESNEIRAGRYCRFLMHVHLIFVSKYRRCVFTKNYLDSMKQIFTKICNDYEAELVAFDGEKDHVY